MINIDEIKIDSTIKCADCGKDSIVEFIAEIDGKFRYELSCHHRNGYCSHCKEMACDVSDTNREIHVLCYKCCDDGYDGSDEFYEANFPNVNKNRVRKPLLGEIRKIYPRASEKWTDDESIALSLFINKMPRHKLSELFNREPNALQIKRSMKSKSALSESCAVRFLGAKICCNGCHYKTILSFKILESLAKKFSTNVLKLEKEHLISVSESFKCKECGEKNVELFF